MITIILTLSTPNLGAVDLPPKFLGYSHISLAPLYEKYGQLYYIPFTGKEQGCDQRQYTAFSIKVYDDERRYLPRFPEGGHYCYNDRSMFYILYLLDRMELEKGVDGWRERYEKWLNEEQARWRGVVEKSQRR